MYLGDLPEPCTWGDLPDPFTWEITGAISGDLLVWDDYLLDHLGRGIHQKGVLSAPNVGDPFLFLFCLFVVVVVVFICFVCFSFLGNGRLLGCFVGCGLFVLRWMVFW